MKRILFTCLLAGSMPSQATTELTICENLEKIEPTKLYRQTVQNVTVSVKQYPLVHNKLKPVKKRRSSQLIADAFYPLELSIENHSSKPIIVDPKAIGLTMMNTGEVASLFADGTAIKEICINGLTPAGIMMLGGGAIVLSAPYVATISGGAFPVIPFFLTAGGLGIYTIGSYIGLYTLIIAIPIALFYQSFSNKNTAYALTLQDAVTLKPNESISKFMFVRKEDFKNDFLISLPTFETMLTKHGRRTKKRMVQSENLTFSVVL